MALCALLAAPGRAEACSCSRPAMQRTLIPASGSTSIPTNARFRVHVSGGYPTALRQQLRDEYRLRDAAGKLVWLKSQVVGRRIDFIPKKPLLPNTRYRIEQLIAYGDTGHRLSDDERWAIASGRGAGTARVAWFPVSSFVTGGGRDRGKPATPQITGAELRFAHGGGDCGPGVALSVDRAGALAPTDVVELEVDGDGVVDSYDSGGALYASDMLCNPDPIFIDAAIKRVRVIVRSLSGATAASPWRSPARSSSRAPQNRRRPGRASANPAVARWSQAPVLASPRAATTGPRGCEHGFVGGKRAEVASAGGPWMFEGLSALAWSGKRGWIAVDGAKDDTSRLIRLDDAGAARGSTPLPGGSSAVAVDGGAAFAVTREFHTSSPRFETKVHVARVSDAGVIEWSRAIGPTSSQGEPRVAAGGGRVLAAWSHTDIHRTGKLGERACWASFDARTGRQLATSGAACRPLAGDGHVGVARLPDGFAIALHIPGRTPYQVAGLELLLVPDRGKPRSVAVKLKGTGGGVDVVADGKRLALVTERDGHIVWALVEPGGALAAGPVEVSRGVGNGNRKARIGFDGSMFAVTWERRNADKTYAAAVDRSARVSAAMELGGGGGTSTAGIAARPGGFVAAFTGESAAHPVAIERLKCGKSDRPPQSIAVSW